MWWCVCQHHFAGKVKDRFLEMEGVAMKQRVGDLLDQSVFGVCVVNEDTYDIFEPRLGRLPEPRQCVSINLLPTSSWSIV